MEGGGIAQGGSAKAHHEVTKKKKRKKTGLVRSPAKKLRSRRATFRRGGEARQKG